MNQQVTFKEKFIEFQLKDQCNADINDVLEDEDVTTPAEVMSLAAHPNPFNPTVQITYTVPKPGRVLIQVWDVAGRLVRTLEDAQRAKGTYQAMWNGNNDAGAMVASGVYFCRMSVGSAAMTHKLMLLR